MITRRTGLPEIDTLRGDFERGTAGFQQDGNDTIHFRREASLDAGKLFQDLRFALRSFRRAPAFPLAAIATLALGIGATTAIFSTLNAVLLKPLPYPQADSLYNIRTTLTDGRITTGMLSNGELSRLEPVSSIAGAGGLQQNELTLIHGDGTPQLVTVYSG